MINYYILAFALTTLGLCIYLLVSRKSNERKIYIKAHTEAANIVERMVEGSKSQIYKLESEVPKIAKEIEAIVHHTAGDASYEWKVIHLFHTYMKDHPDATQKAVFHAILFALEKSE